MKLFDDDATDDDSLSANVNDNSFVGTFGLVETLVLSMMAFSILMAIFETNRFYRQIYLKRLQNRFRQKNRVPPYPSESTFGWFFEIQKISEGEFLKMVGLDAYMCLRYIVICYKLSLFLSFWGLLVLVPVYASANSNERWDRYSISNLINEDTPEGYKYRLWVPTIMGYLFATYFCQLLYAEYNNFSVRRLQYLVQANPEDENVDPDTPPQKYFTVMVERIPPHLRSAAALNKFFNKLFPGEVYCVEIAMDIEDLDTINAKRKRIRAKLERAVAHYEAKNERLQVYALTGHKNEELEADLRNGIFGDDGIIEFIYKSFAPERYGYEKVDALNYYTNKLIRLNNEVKELQEKYRQQATQCDENMQRKLQNRYDTRVAAVLENITYHGAKTLQGLSTPITKNRPTNNNHTVPDLSTVPTTSAELTNPLYSSTTTTTPAHFSTLPIPNQTNQDYDQVFTSSLSITHRARKLLQDFSVENLLFGPSKINKAYEEQMNILGDSFVTTKEKEEELILLGPDGVVAPSSHSQHGGSSNHGDHHASLPPPTTTGSLLDSLLEEEHTFQQWKKKSSTTYDDKKAQQEIAHKHAENMLHHHIHSVHQHHEDVWRRESKLEMKTYLENSESSHPHQSSVLHQHNSGGDGVGDGSAKNSRHGQPLIMNDGSVANQHVDISVPPSNTPSGQEQPEHALRSSSHPRPSVTQPPPTGVNMTQSGGVSTVLPLNMLDGEQLNEFTKLSIEQAKLASKGGWTQTKLVGFGALRGITELERWIEYLTIGAYVKYSSTAFVTFNHRVTESIAQQMLLSLDTMEINHAPNPKDIIWENVAIPKSQVVMRSYITNIGLIVGSIFWSSLVNSVNTLASYLPVSSTHQQQSMSAVIMLLFLLILPTIFDALARNYEGLKLESEIQNSIMTRYFYYQLINVGVTAGFGGKNIWRKIISVLNEPKLLVDILGGNLPNVSLFFTKLLIVKIFSAIPLEMIRPFQLSTIHLMTNCMNRRTTTRRDLRTGVFYSWPMLYGRIYPQLMMVLMIMVTYACITPLIMPFCVLFFAGAYIMYKYQLLYVYINEDQSGGYMWYAVFNRSLVALQFASLGLLGYLALQLNNGDLAAPFYFTIPLPIAVMYFGQYCEQKFKKASENLSYGFARELDHRNDEYRAQNKSTPHDTFTKTCYRQPSLTDSEVYPEPYRNDGSYDIVRNTTTGESVLLHDFRNARYNRLGSLSINVHELTDEGEEDQRVLEEYFQEVVLPLSEIPKEENGNSSVHRNNNFDEEGFSMRTRERR